MPSFCGRISILCGRRRNDGLDLENETEQGQWSTFDPVGFIEKVRDKIKLVTTNRNQQVLSLDVADPEEEEVMLNPEDVFTDVNDCNVEQLYSEVLYETLHSIGCDTGTYEQEELFLFLREAFHFDDEKHDALLEDAKAKEAPKLVLNVEIMEARRLRPKGYAGFSDPFCTMHVSSFPSAQQQTSVKPNTLDPVWGEHFSIPVNEAEDDMLIVEIWNFNKAEPIRKKLNNIGTVKGARGARKLMRDIVKTASKSKLENELLGRTQIPLKMLPTEGMQKWYELDKNRKAGGRRGEVQVKLSLSAGKNPQVACREHRLLLQLFLEHEMEVKKFEAYKWDGEFGEMASRVVSQHRAQSNLDSVHESLACWAEYCHMHAEHALSFQLFGRLLGKLSGPVENGILNEEELKLFWDSVKKLLPSCMNILGQVSSKALKDEATLKHIQDVLDILRQLEALTPPAGTALFPSSSVTDLPLCDIRQSVLDKVQRGAEERFEVLLESKDAEESSQEAYSVTRFGHLANVVAQLQDDLQCISRKHDKIYKEKFDLQFAKVTFAVYSTKICEHIKPMIEETYHAMSATPKTKNENSKGEEINNDVMTTGTSLFVLYLTLQPFSKLGHEIAPDKTHQVRQFHTWFHRGVTQWLDIALYKAMKRISKAVELCCLRPIDEKAIVSSSAVDTVSVFYQIVTFWKELSWPDSQSSYKLMKRIIQDNCSCSIDYADHMSRRVFDMEKVKNEKMASAHFEVSQEWCTAINNIDHIRENIEPFMKKLGLEELVSALTEQCSLEEAQRCEKKLRAEADAIITKMDGKILELINALADQMCPSMHRFLKEGAKEKCQYQNVSAESVMGYLDKNLAVLHGHLSRENFKQTLSVVWDRVANQLVRIVDAGLKAKRHPYFFKNLSETLQVLEDFFVRDLEAQKSVSNLALISGDNFSELLKVTKEKLKLHALETPDLIMAYRLNRLAEQERMSLSEPLLPKCCGQLTARLMIIKSKLYVEILNGVILKPSKSNGTRNPYAKIYLVESPLNGEVSQKTATQMNTLSPFFDSTLMLPLSSKTLKDEGLVRVVLKDQKKFRRNKLVGEAYVPLSSISTRSCESDLSSLEQVRLPLTRPSRSQEYSAFDALKQRKSDAAAKRFVKKEKLSIPRKCVE